MITTNGYKKKLIEQLLQDRHISLDDALILLEESIGLTDFIGIPYVQPIDPYTTPSLPWYNWPTTISGYSGTIVADGGNLSTGNFITTDQVPVGSFLSYTLN